MVKTALIILLFSVPSLALAQEREEDPFKRDPIFTKTIEELLGLGEQEEDEAEEATSVVRSRSHTVHHLTVRGLDLGGGLESGPYYSNELYSLYPNLSSIHFNRVNGLFIGIRKERMQWHRRGSFLQIPQIEPHGFIGYGTASREWEYAIGLEKLFGSRNRVMAGVEYHKATATEDFRRTGLIENSLTAFFGSYDFLDYHRMEGFGVYSAARTQRWFEFAFSFNRTTFSSLDLNTTYSMFGRTSVYRPNPPVDRDADEIDLDIYGLSVSFNPRNVLLTNRFSVSAGLRAELSDNNLDDNPYRYEKYHSTLQMYYNFEPGSVLRWRFQAGGITGNVPDFKAFYLGGIGTLRGSPFKFFQGKQMLLSNIEVQFGRPPRDPDEWIGRHGWQLLLFLDSGWAREIPEMTDGSNPLDGFSHFSFSDLQHDIGLGLGSRAIRFELGWPLREFDRSPVFWVRFNPTF